MKRNRFLTALLSLVMLLSLVPVSALADEEPVTDPNIKYGHYEKEYNQNQELDYILRDGAPVQNLPEGVVSLDKVAEKTDDPYMYNITLSVVMKQTTATTAPGAAATVLAIDCSGSMAYCAKHGEGACDCKATYQEIAATSLVTSKTYYIKDANGQYTAVKYCDGTHYFLSLIPYDCPGGAGWYPVYASHNASTKIDTAKNTFYERNDGTRADAAKAAARAFLASYSGFTAFEADGFTLPEGAADLSYGRYLSVVLFESSAKTQQSWVDVSTVAGYKAALAAIDAAYSDGGTNLDAALKTADSLLDADAVKNIAAKNTIALTDGEPTYYVNSNGNNVRNNGDSCGETTFKETIKSAAALKNDGVKLYTVCFASGSEEMTDYDNKTNERPATYGSITLADYLKTKIATQPAQGSSEQFAYAAADSAALTAAFQAIGSSITTGLNAGLVQDGLPDGVSTENEGFVTTEGFSALSWELKAEDAAKTTENGTTLYTWTYTYTVTIDPDEVVTDEDGYAPLNTPTTLTVTVDNQPVELGFPIPCVKLPTPAEVDLNGDTDEDGSYTGLIFKNLSYGENASKLALSFEAKVEEEVDEGETGATYVGAVAFSDAEDGIKPFQFLQGGKLTFNQAGIYRYAVTETPNTNTVADDISVSYDDTAWTLVIRVTYDAENNQFVAAPYFDKANADMPALRVIFNNTVSQESEPEPDEPTTGTLMLKKVVTGLEDADKEYTVEVKDADGTVVATAKLKAGDEVPSTEVELAPGTYTITETDASVDGYDLTTTYSSGNDGVTVTATGATAVITAGNEVLVTVTNAYTENEPDEPTTGTLMLKKVVTGLEDADKEYTVEVKDADGTVVATAKLKAGDEVPSTEVELAPGTYTITETDASVDGYDLTTTYSSGNDGVTVTATGATAVITAGNEVLVTVTNAYTENEPDEPTTGTLMLKKVVTGLEDADKEYTVEVKDADGTVVATAKLKAGDEVPSTEVELAPGTYTITETDASVDGYDLTTTYSSDNDGVTVTATGATAVITAGNEVLVTVTNAYTESEEPNPPTPPTPETYDYTVNYFVDVDGSYAFHSYEDGKAAAGTVITAESKAKTIDGYTYDHASPASITVSANGENVLNLYYNKKSTTPVDPPYVPTTGSVDIRKTDAENGSKLAGATFSLYRVTANGDAFVASVTTNAAGQATASGLMPGKYVAIETVAPEGYVLDNTRHEFTVIAGAVATKLNITNEKANFVNRHEAYIIGYPDGTVRPTGSLSRAEAATIFFRLLADDMREANMTSVNPFSDVPAGLWCNHAISTLYALGIIDPAETFRPDDTITRSEFAALAERFGKVVKASEFGAISTWVGSGTHYAAALGLSGGSFPADEPISRAEAMMLVNRVLGRVPQGTGSLLANMIVWPDNTDVSAWFYIAVQEATNSHDASKLDVWQLLRAVRDWAALEF